MKWLESLKTAYRKHDFDYEDPFVDEVTIVETHVVSGKHYEPIVKKIISKGYKCKNCSMVLWLDKETIIEYMKQRIPYSMFRGCPNTFKEKS